MPGNYCYRCGAELSHELVCAVPDRFDCPQCGETIELAAVAPELDRQQGQRRFVAAESFQHEQPPGDRLQCRVAEDQLVIAIPAGSNEMVRWLGRFVVAWLAGAGIFTAHVYTKGFGDRLELMHDLAALGVVWAVALATAGWWIKVRLGKTLILVEPDRLVMKFVLLGVETFRQYRLAAYSKARLVVDHARDSEPVYKIAISAAGQQPHFGEFLLPAEKQWIVERINRHLGREDRPELVAGLNTDGDCVGLSLMDGFKFGE